MISHGDVWTLYWVISGQVPSPSPVLIPNDIAVIHHEVSIEPLNGSYQSSALWSKHNHCTTDTLTRTYSASFGIYDWVWSSKGNGLFPLEIAKETLNFHELSNSYEIVMKLNKGAIPLGFFVFNTNLTFLYKIDIEGFKK